MSVIQMCVRVYARDPVEVRSNREALNRGCNTDLFTHWPCVRVCIL